MPRFAALALAILVAACGTSEDPSLGPDAGVDAGTPDAYVDLSGPVFEPNHIVDVSITMAANDWNAMRVETRTIGSVIEGDCLAQPAPSPFMGYSAAITIDGTTFPQVGIHKKGFLGSLDDTKPSLKIKLDEFVPGTEYLGLEKLTLNNSHQDPAYVRQCVSYQLFAAAGIVVPRCNFAHVRVNGTDLGIYVNVETIDHHLTKKRYANGTGNIYEGTLSDLRPGWTGTFDAKGGGDGSDLMPATNVIANSPDATLVADLAPYLDLDRFKTFWAMEVIANHWDGYANDRNNYFIYHDPTSDKLDFIPWGPDGALQKDATFGNLGSTSGPIAVAANGALAHRLFAIPATRQEFLDRQRALLTSAFDETKLLTEITRMENLIAPIVNSVQGMAWHADVTGVRQFVQGRRAKLVAALDAGPTWTDPLSGYPCLAIQAHATGTFSTTWGTIGAANPFTTGTGTFSLTVGTVTTTLTPVGARAGLDPTPAPGTSAQAMVQVFGQRASDGHILVFSMAIPPAIFFARTGTLGFFDSNAAVYDFDPATNTTVYVGFTLGKFTLTQASTTSGATITGSFDANVDQQGTAPP